MLHTLRAVHDVFDTFVPGILRMLGDHNQQPEQTRGHFVVVMHVEGYTECLCLGCVRSRWAAVK